MSDSFLYKGVIIPKPRMTRADTWKKRPIVLHYFQFKDEINKQAKNQDFILGGDFNILFKIPMPKSWSNKKRVEFDNTPHKSRPDLDNLLKAVQDCLLKEDGLVWKVTAIKLWTSGEAKIYIENSENPDLDSILEDALSI